MVASTRTTAAVAVAGAVVAVETKKKTVLKDITNNGKEASKRKSAPHRKTSDVGPSTVPPVESGITTRSRSAKKPAAVSGRTAVIEKEAKNNNDEVAVAPAASTLEEKFYWAADPAVSSVNGKKRKALDDLSNKDNKRQRRVVTRAAARKIAGASLPGLAFARPPFFLTLFFSDFQLSKALLRSSWRNHQYCPEESISDLLRPSSSSTQVWTLLLLLRCQILT